MSRTVELFMIRHAQSHPHAEIPNSDWPLSPVGRRQATQLADVLARLELEHVVSSPFKRCLETIGPFVERHGYELDVHEDLRERLLARKLLREFEPVWHRAWTDFEYARPGCESSREAQTRFVSAIHEICETTSHRRIGISSHGNVIGLLAHHIDPSYGREHTESIRNPDIRRFVWERGALHYDCDYVVSEVEMISTCSSETPLRFE